MARSHINLKCASAIISKPRELLMVYNSFHCEGWALKCLYKPTRLLYGGPKSSSTRSTKSYVEPGYNNSNCLANDSALARCPPPVSEDKNSTFMPMLGFSDDGDDVPSLLSRFRVSWDSSVFTLDGGTGLIAGPSSADADSFGELPAWVRSLFAVVSPASSSSKIPVVVAFLPSL